MYLYVYMFVRHWKKNLVNILIETVMSRHIRHYRVDAIQTLCARQINNEKSRRIDAMTSTRVNYKRKTHK